MEYSQFVSLNAGLQFPNQLFFCLFTSTAYPPPIQSAAAVSVTIRTVTFVTVIGYSGSVDWLLEVGCGYLSVCDRSRSWGCCDVRRRRWLGIIGACEMLYAIQSTNQVFSSPSPLLLDGGRHCDIRKSFFTGYSSEAIHPPPCEMEKWFHPARASRDCGCGGGFLSFRLLCSWFTTLLGGVQGRKSTGYTITNTNVIYGISLVRLFS